MTQRIRSIAARLREAEGFSMVEVVIAILLLGVGSLAVFQIFDASTRSTFRAEQGQAAVNIAQREIEELRNLDYEAIALTSIPTFVDDDNDPRIRVEGANFDDGNDGVYRQMVHDATGGQIAPGPEEFQSGDITGDVYRFVVWRNDPTCPDNVCPGGQDLKRVVVAVKLDTVAASYERPYIEVQSDFTDPEASVDGPLPAGDEVNVPQQLWLTDTTCDHTNRQPIANDDPLPEGHSLHNTLGPCGDGLQTGSVPGAPDLLEGTALPPDPNPNDPADPPIYDYATDVEPLAGPDDDGGLQISRRSEDGCSYTAGNSQQIHRWVSNSIDPVALPSGFVLDGDATLKLFIRTLGGAQHQARLCVFLFRRSDETDTVFHTEEFLVADVPSADWDVVTVPLSFPMTTIQPGNRVGLAIGLERGGTPADTIQILYDHPEAKSRLEVVTPTPIAE